MNILDEVNPPTLDSIKDRFIGKIIKCVQNGNIHKIDKDQNIIYQTHISQGYYKPGRPITIMIMSEYRCVLWMEDKGYAKIIEQ